MKIAKVQFTNEDLDWLDRQAAHQNVSRAELIRRRVLGKEDGQPPRYTPRQYQELVSAANRYCDMPRNQVERLVSFVFCQIMEPDRVEASPGQ